METETKQNKKSRECRHEAEYLSLSDNLNEQSPKRIKFLINQAVQDFFSNTFPTTVFKLKYILISYTISNNEM